MILARLVLGLSAGRDSEGLVIGAFSEQINLPPSVIEAEALACRRAIIFAMELGLQKAVFEGDSEILMKNMHSESSSLSRFGHLVDNSCAAASKLRSCFFSHALRDCIRVADKLAKNSKFLLSPLICIENIPVNVSPSVTHDRLHGLI